MHVFGVRCDTRAGREQLEAWRVLSSGAFAFRCFHGDHFFINSRRAELLALVADSLNSLLAAAGSAQVPA